MLAYAPYDAVMGETSTWRGIERNALWRNVLLATDDLRITVYTAEPGTEDAERLALAVVLGTRALALADERRSTPQVTAEHPAP
nr:hypothetical protein [Frankia sp. CcI49]